MQVVKTHLRDMIIVPEMIGSIVGVYNGKTFNQVEVKVCELAHDFIMLTVSLPFGVQWRFIVVILHYC